MFPQIIIFIIKYTAIVSIDHMSLIILIVAFLIPSVRHMYMPCLLYTSDAADE